MSHLRAVLKRGDTRTAIQAILLEPAGTPVDLTNASVRFHMVDHRGVLRISKTIDIIDAVRGMVRVVFEPGETAAAGLYRAEFAVIFPDGRKETYPNHGYVTVHIVPDLG